MGTAGNMTIEENLALAARRGRNAPSAGASRKASESSSKSCSAPGTGAGGPAHCQGGAALRRTAAGPDPAHGIPEKPKVLLLDEHTAALDPKTAAKVLELSDQIVEEHKLTTLMVTHNMKDAIAHGNRLIMLDAGRVIPGHPGRGQKADSA